MSDPLHLFDAFGIELEYMLVARDVLDVLPASDSLIKAANGSIEAEIERGPIAWSNELVLHVIELKTNGPTKSLTGLTDHFLTEVRAINGLLEPMGGRLMPTAMHPWMHPQRETRLWPHEYSAVYATFDSMFGCKGHGWSNLQSCHINLPFCGDAELAKLHNAIRIVLPLLPALAASSPIVERKRTGLLDSRLEMYRHNCRRVPSVSGRVIPDVIVGAADYRRNVLDVIAADVAPFDHDGVLEPEWVNARGAIVRFIRDSIEIRLLDIQEHPGADLAIADLVIATVRELVDERYAGHELQCAIDTERLERAFLEAVRYGERAVIDDPDYLACLGVEGDSLEAREIWRQILDRVEVGAEYRRPLATIIEHGTLASRILRALDTKGESLQSVYAKLCDCLHHGQMFIPG